jgi:hypothetical protein
MADGGLHPAKAATGCRKGPFIDNAGENAQLIERELGQHCHLLHR